VAHPLRLVAVTHGALSAANREAVIRLVDAVASERPELDVSISFVDASNADVAAALAADAEPDAVIVPLVLSAGFHVRTGLSLGLDRIGGGRSSPPSSVPTTGSSPCSPSGSTHSAWPTATPCCSPRPDPTTRAPCASASRPLAGSVIGSAAP
jgi:sirohydrochlorin ferrochelatase